MSILVTGGMGYIGSHTCVELLNAGREVVVADNLSNSSAEAGRRVERITGKPIKFYQIDLRDRPALDRLFEENDIDAVLHFAGLKAVGESVSIPLAYYDNNLGAAITLCESMCAHGVKKILFSSSATVYDIGKELPLSETSPRGNCTNPYSWSKYMVEQILRDTAKADPAWSVMLLRYFNPVGAHESGLIGEDPRGIPNNLMPYICGVAVGRYPYLNIWGGDYATPDGTGVRDYIHVVDLAKGHLAAMEYMESHPGETAFNLGTGRGHSVLEVVSAFEKASGVKIPYQIGPRRPGDLDLFYASPEKSAGELGWKAERTLADMCRDCWNWQSKNPFGYGQ